MLSEYIWDWNTSNWNHYSRRRLTNINDRNDNVHWLQFRRVNQAGSSATTAVASHPDGSVIDAMIVVISLTNETAALFHQVSIDTSPRAIRTLVGSEATHGVPNHVNTFLMMMTRLTRILSVNKDFWHTYYPEYRCAKIFANGQFYTLTYRWKRSHVFLDTVYICI